MERARILRSLVAGVLGLGWGLGVTAHEHGPTTQTVQEQLGYPAGAKLLIIHADDLGMSHSKNVATFQAMREGVVTSASVMMPTPWVAEALELSQEHPELDLGVHLTLTAEWKHYKWGPILGADTVPSLVTEQGVFHDEVPAFAAAADIAEVEAEVRAQIDRARELGFDMTHLDGHMGAMLATDELAALYLRMGREYRLPVRVHSHHGEAVTDPKLQERLAHYPASYMTIHGAPPDTYPEGMLEYYNQVLRELKPGLNLLVLHLGYDDPEMQAIMVEHPLWGARWRQIDYDWAMSPKTRAIMEEEGIILIDNRGLRDRLIRGKMD
jgi:predicted glycoside hydrolase/deacetylase ChbG (UPF0249 family)